MDTSKFIWIIKFLRLDRRAVHIRQLLKRDLELELDGLSYQTVAPPLLVKHHWQMICLMPLLLLAKTIFHLHQEIPQSLQLQQLSCHQTCQVIQQLEILLHVEELREIFTIQSLRLVMRSHGISIRLPNMRKVMLIQLLQASPWTIMFMLKPLDLISGLSSQPARV